MKFKLLVKELIQSYSKKRLKLQISLSSFSLRNFQIKSPVWYMLSRFSCVWLTIDCSPPGSSVHGFFQARILEWNTCPPPEDLHDPRIKTVFLSSPALAGRFFSTDSATWETRWCDIYYLLTALNNSFIDCLLDVLDNWWKMDIYCVFLTCIHLSLYWQQNPYFHWGKLPFLHSYAIHFAWHRPCSIPSISTCRHVYEPRLANQNFGSSEGITSGEW